jgi:hypothetical protein
MRAAAFAASFVPASDPAASPVAADEPAWSAPTIERVTLPVRQSSYRTLRQREHEKATRLTLVPDPVEEEPVAEIIEEPVVEMVEEPAVRIARPVERDLRLVALESTVRLVALEPAGETWDLRRAREDEETDRVDERLVLLREHAISQRLGSIAV